MAFSGNSGWFLQQNIREDFGDVKVYVFGVNGGCSQFIRANET
jgi:hypothetical protein